MSEGRDHTEGRATPVAPDDSKRAPGSAKVVSQQHELFQRIQQSEGEKIHWKLEALRASYHVFSQNHVELCKSIEHFEAQQNVHRYWLIEERERLSAFQFENMRLFHNFLAGAFTLVDHTRILVRKLYAQHAFLAEYRKRVDHDFSTSDIAGFVKGLRNWMVHRGLVPVKVQASLSAGKLVASIVLDLEQLGTGDRWDPRGRRYLSDATAPLRLKDVVNSYYDHVESFYSWLGNRMAQIHAPALEELDRLQKQLRAMLPTPHMEALRRLASRRFFQRLRLRPKPLISSNLSQHMTTCLYGYVAHG